MGEGAEGGEAAAAEDEAVEEEEEEEKEDTQTDEARLDTSSPGFLCIVYSHTLAAASFLARHDVPFPAQPPSVSASVAAVFNLHRSSHYSKTL